MSDLDCPIIFLDIDGVFITVRSSAAGEFRSEFDEAEAGQLGVQYKPRDFPHVDHIAVDLFNRLVQESGAKIVVSSSHRLMFVKRYGYSESQVVDLVGLREYIHNMGVIGEVIDATPSMFAPRGDEIRLWLRLHKNVKNYVIVDDDADMLEEHLERLVHTSTVNGFTYESYRKALKLLTGKLAPIESYLLSRTQSLDASATVFEMDDEVVYLFRGVQGRGKVKGLAFQNHEFESYVIEDMSGHFPNPDHPFSHIVVDVTSLCYDANDKK